MPLYRRLPKRGFLPYGGKTEFAIVNVGDLSGRFAAGSVIDPDAMVSSRLIRKFCPLDDPCLNILKGAVQELGLSARAHDKILRLARTIADLDGSEPIKPDHLHEAVNYRMLDRNLWK